MCLISKVDAQIARPSKSRLIVKATPGPLIGTTRPSHARAGPSPKIVSPPSRPMERSLKVSHQMPRGKRVPTSRLVISRESQSRVMMAKRLVATSRAAMDLKAHHRLRASPTAKRTASVRPRQKPPKVEKPSRSANDFSLTFVTIANAAPRFLGAVFLMRVWLR